MGATSSAVAREMSGAFTAKEYDAHALLLKQHVASSRLPLAPAVHARAESGQL